MSAEIIKLPYSVTRGAFSRKPRNSKNGTPEERAARVAATQGPPARIVPLAPQEPAIDRRKLRGNPLRENVAPISLATTIVGKLYTADLREETIDLEAVSGEGWISILQAGMTAANFAACELEKAIARLERMQEKSEISDFPVNLPVSDSGQPVLNLVTGQDQ